MSGSVKIALFILAVGVNILGSCADPCAGDGGGNPGPPSEPGKPTRCRELGGYCYNALCKNCTDGHIRTDLCGDDENENRKCCLPGPPPPFACCEIFSDPHIRSFDGLYYDVQVPGTFTVSTPCSSSEFSVRSKFEYPYGGAIWTKTVEVIVVYGSTTIVIKQDGSVLVNGGTVALDHWMPPDVHIFQNGDNIYVRIYSIDLLVCYNIRTMRLTVYVGIRWSGKLCGICGNFNEDSRDDQQSVPSNLVPDEKCPQPRDHDDWALCRRELHKAMEECEGNDVNRYLESCAFDICSGGMQDAQFTLDAAKEHCASNVTDIMALPPPENPENGS